MNRARCAPTENDCTVWQMVATVCNDNQWFPVTIYSRSCRLSNHLSVEQIWLQNTPQFLHDDAGLTLCRGMRNHNCRDTRKSTKDEKCDTSINCALRRTQNVGTRYYSRLTEIPSHVRFVTVCCSWVEHLSKIRMRNFVIIEDYFEHRRSNCRVSHTNGQFSKPSEKYSFSGRASP